jgi:hypothetical protein
MPYLNCPGCRLTIYSGRKAIPPRLCTRCGARLGGPVRSLFKSTGPSGISGSRVLEALRERRTASQSQLKRRANRPTV